MGVLKTNMYFLFTFIASFFLFTVTANALLGSTVLFYFVMFVSIVLTTSFIYKYTHPYKNLLSKQLIIMSQSNSNSWHSWISNNLAPITNIFLYTTPYIIVLVSVLKGISFLFPVLSFLNYVSLFIMCSFMMLMIFLLTTHLISTSRKNEMKGSNER